MLAKTFLSEIEIKIYFDKPLFGQKYWEWANNIGSLIGKWFIDKLWLFYICDSAEDTRTFLPDNIEDTNPHLKCLIKRLVIPFILVLTEYIYIANYPLTLPGCI